MSAVSNKGDRAQALRGLAIMNTDDGYFSGAPIVWDALSSGQREQLNQLLHQGPVWDGNVISKSCRDDLIDYDLASAIMYDPAFQKACQRYAHGSGSSGAIAMAAASVVAAHCKEIAA